MLNSGFIKQFCVCFGGYQRLLCCNLTTVLVVLLSGLWLLLGCDNYGNQVMYPAWNIYQQPIFCINLLSVPESSVSLSGEYWNIAYVLPNPTTGLGPFWILLEKLGQVTMMSQPGWFYWLICLANLLLFTICCMILVISY